MAAVMVDVVRATPSLPVQLRTRWVPWTRTRSPVREEVSAVLAAVRRLVPRVEAAVDVLAEPVRAREILEAGRRRAAAPAVSEDPATDWAAELSEDKPDGAAGLVIKPLP